MYQQIQLLPAKYYCTRSVGTELILFSDIEDSRVNLYKQLQKLNKTYISQYL